MNGRQAHRLATLALSMLMVAIGLALLVEALTAHASAISPRVLLGVLFIAAGGGRTYVEMRRGRSG